MKEYQDGLGLLDMLVAVARSMRLIVVVPLLVGAVTYGICYLVPQSYVSQSLLSLPATTATQASSIMVSPIVLTPVVRQLDLKAGGTEEAARMKLEDRILTFVGKDGLLRLEATADTPLKAQSIANAVIDSWLATTVPGPRDREDLEKRLSYATTSLNAVRRFQERVVSEVPANLNQPMTRGESGAGIIAIGELQARYLNEVLTVARSLQGLNRDVIVQPPTLPVEPTAPRKGIVATLAALGTLLLALMWTLTATAWRTASFDPGVREKQTRLLNAFGLKPKPPMEYQNSIKPGQPIGRPVGQIEPRSSPEHG